MDDRKNPKQLGLENILTDSARERLQTAMETRTGSPIQQKTASEMQQTPLTQLLFSDVEVEFREKVEVYHEKFSPPGPVETLIVEQPLQRDDNPMPPNTSGDFVRELPVEATPNVAMPDELQGSDNIQYQPVLDLFRYKTNRYWNQLRFDGKLSPSQQEFIGPIVWIDFPSTTTSTADFVQGDDKIKYIAGPLDTHGSNRRTVNPFSKLLKETITIAANPVVFGDPAIEGFNHTNEGLTFNNNIPEGLTTDPNAADAADVSAAYSFAIRAHTDEDNN